MSNLDPACPSGVTENGIAFAELHCLTPFSFQRGASSARDLVHRAHALGYTALAITDECTMSGVVRALEAAEEVGLKLIYGTEITLVDGLKLVLLAQSLLGYQQLCRLITTGRMRSQKGDYALQRSDFEGCNDADSSRALTECLALWCPGSTERERDSVWVAQHFPGRAWISYSRFLMPDDEWRLSGLEKLARQSGLPLVATNEVHYDVRERRRLHDVMTAIRVGKPVTECGTELFPNGEHHLRPTETLRKLYPPALLRETQVIADRCHFGLRQIRYTYPHELTPVGCTAIEHLTRLTEEGLVQRYPAGAPDAVRRQVEHELRLIAELGYEHFFLTVEELVRFARGRGILCQGRGSAANSAVCFALGITEVNPAETQLLFERFLSKERNEAPDIDVDFEHERREEVIQHIYAKYGRERAALAATVTCYRRDSAIKDVGKALGFSETHLAALTKRLAYWDKVETVLAECEKLGFDPNAELVRHFFELVGEIKGMPRHLSQHVGGFVISDEPLWCLVPIENAAMVDRSIIQWDKEDLETLGLLKVDCLALGMLSALRHMLQLLSKRDGREWRLSDIPRDDPATFEMITRADTVGVFQIESRAQMSMLPRLKPKQFYDLVIEVAIVRPGPIQGQMVHPYLRRRCGEEEVIYPSEELKRVLERTLGIPLFQEQVMQVAIVAGGFSPGEADQVRRSMAAWTRKGGLQHFRDRLMAGMAERGYDPIFAENIYQQILGFGSYGFPESHAASFAILTYFSCWLKCHEPEAFLAGLLNAQPLGFYAPAQLINDARREKPHCAAVEVRPVDITCSSWLSTLVRGPKQRPAVRLGMSLVRGLSGLDGARVEEWQRSRRDQGQQGATSIQAFVDAVGLNRKAVNSLAEAGAFERLVGHRNAARWASAGVERLPGLLKVHSTLDDNFVSKPPSEAEEIAADYQALSLTLRRHPLSLLRAKLKMQRVVTAQDLVSARDGSFTQIAGVVTHRQRPGTASGIIFVTLEDETGTSNLIVKAKVQEQYRTALLGGQLLRVRGRVQNAGGVINVIAKSIHDESALLGNLLIGSRDFH